MAKAANIRQRIDRGLALQRDGRWQQSERLLRKVLQAQPDNPDALHLLGLAARHAGKLEVARKLIERAIAKRPSAAFFRVNLANVLIELGELDAALAACDLALRLAPNLAAAYTARGNILHRRGQLEEACEAYSRALRLDPQAPEPALNRGAVLADLGRAQDALADYDRVLAIAPSLAQAHNNRSNLLLAQGRVAEALEGFAEAIRLEPDYAEAHNNRGVALEAQRQTQQALSAFDDALRLRPDYAEAHNNRGAALRTLGRTADALAAFEAALRLRPDDAEAHNNRAGILKDQGRLDEALGSYRRALEIRPDYAEAHSNYLFCLNYSPDVDAAALAEAHRRWGQRHGSPASPYTAHDNPRDRARRLRIGLVSADFYRHPVGFLIDGVLAALDPAQTEVVCYSGGVREDALTERLKSHAGAWRSSLGLGDRALAERIRADGIDILVDLSGHTAGNRLTCFALTPAPVQVSWLGYCHGTGLPAIDYLLADPHFVPPGAERDFAETVVRLPQVRWCYTAPDYAPEVAPPPALRNGHVTFGSFNNLSKLNDRVIALWARLLREVPRARLLLSWPSLADSGQRTRLGDAFAAQGVGKDRLSLTQGAATHAEVLGGYAEVDVALDPFPFAGGLTSCEALWMGVPVVTLPDDRPASRQTLGFLAALGRTDWCAADEDAFARIAADLAADPDRLAADRQQQRDRMAASALCDADRFARDLTAALRDMWRAWCAKSPAETT